MTGVNGPNKTLERFGISGTDLGIAWDNGDPANRQVLMAFGDTFGYCRVHGQQWRYNTLFRSSDHDRRTESTWRPVGYQQIRRFAVVSFGPVQTDHQHHEARRHTRPESFRPPESPSGKRNS